MALEPDVFAGPDHSTAARIYFSCRKTMTTAFGQPALADQPVAMRTHVPRLVSLATHYYPTGPAFDLENYLAPQTSVLLFAAHPLYGRGYSFYRRDSHRTLTSTG